MFCDRHSELSITQGMQQFDNSDKSIDAIFAPDKTIEANDDDDDKDVFSNEPMILVIDDDIYNIEVIKAMLH